VRTRRDNLPMPDTRKTQLDALAVGSLVLCCFLWGLNQVATKVALSEIPPLWQAGVRSLVAGALVLAWAAWRRAPLRHPEPGASTLRGGLLAGALFAGEFACVFWGLQYTSASRMVVFVYLSPFVVALGMPLISRHERLSGVQSLGLLGAFAGVAWAFAEGFSQPGVGSQQWLGDALGVAAALMWGATTLTIRASKLSQAPAETTLLYQLGVSGVLLCAGALALGETWPAQISALAWASMGFQVVVVSFASYLLWFWLMRHYPATQLAAFSLLTPVFGLLLGALLLGEVITTRLLIALAAVALGIVVVNRSR
jgi:drug/metabolite transporter (DMT)-like permease